MSNLIEIKQPVLSHPWYRAWECGKVTKEGLQIYAQEYYWQVANFPRYLSALHAQTEELSDRQVILRNLMDEENENQPHPELWLDFAESLGLDRSQVRNRTPGPAAMALVEEFRSVVKSGQPEALGALLAYESQVPEVAKFKTKALNEFYLEGDAAEKGTRFFKVHEEADVWHTRELEGILAKMSDRDRARAQVAADRCGKALWQFLDAMPA